MRELESHRAHPVLKQLVAEASRALARLDVDRLEELALCCRTLNRDLIPLGREERVSLARQAGDASGDMAVFARVLEVTRANLNVMRRLRELHQDRLEYGDGSAAASRGCAPLESGYGDN